MCSAEHTMRPGVNQEKKRRGEEKDMNKGWQENTGADFPKNQLLSQGRRKQRVKKKKKQHRENSESNKEIRGEKKSSP